MKTEMKINIMYNVGKVKYLVSYSDGTKQHKDGSEFFDIECFKNKQKMYAFISELKTVKAEFTTFDKSSNWVSGTVGEYNFEAKLFDESSIFGIKKGRVSKLSIYKKREESNGLSVEVFKDFFASCIVNYDRGMGYTTNKRT